MPVSVSPSQEIDGDEADPAECNMAPVIVPPAKGSLVAIELVIVVENEASSFNAAANSFKELRAAGLESTRLLTAVVTYAVVASWVVLVAAEAVGASGVPVKVGLATGATPASANVWLIHLEDELSYCKSSLSEIDEMVVSSISSMVFSNEIALST